MDHLWNSPLIYIQLWYLLNWKGTFIWPSQVAQWERICLQETWVRSLGQEDPPPPRRRKWQPVPVFLPGESHGQRNLVGYSPWGHKELDTTERLTPTQLYTVTCLCSELTQCPGFGLPTAAPEHELFTYFPERSHTVWFKSDSREGLGMMTDSKQGGRPSSLQTSSVRPPALETSTDSMLVFSPWGQGLCVSFIISVVCDTQHMLSEKTETNQKSRGRGLS